MAHGSSVHVPESLSEWAPSTTPQWSSCGKPSPRTVEPTARRTLQPTPMVLIMALNCEETRMRWFSAMLPICILRRRTDTPRFRYASWQKQGTAYSSMIWSCVVFRASPDMEQGRYRPEATQRVSMGLPTPLPSTSEHIRAVTSQDRKSSVAGGYHPPG